MKKVLVTGGTVFVSRYIAGYYLQKGWEVYVLNRNTRPQLPGVRLIQADRMFLKDVSFPSHLDLVIDTAYTAGEVDGLLHALKSYGDYIFISSSAVYPEHSPSPFTEETPTGPNRYWGSYGTDKVAAEHTLLAQNPNAYVVRPPYLYGPMNNVYREAFVFECAQKNRPFYLPGDGSMELQFFHIRDLCRFLDALLEKRPPQHIFNVGNPDMVSVRQWVKLCYLTVGKNVSFFSAPGGVGQRNYFPFYDYEYRLDVSRQRQLLENTIPLPQGLNESFAWYQGHSGQVVKKPFLNYIDTVLAPGGVH